MGPIDPQYLSMAVNANQFLLIDLAVIGSDQQWEQLIGIDPNLSSLGNDPGSPALSERKVEMMYVFYIH